MPQVLSRAREWFSARSTLAQGIIILAAILVLVFASPVLKWVTVPALLGIIVASIVRAARRAPVRNLLIAAGALVVGFFIFDAIASAVYGPSGGGTQEVARQQQETQQQETQAQEETTEADTDSQPLDLFVYTPAVSATVDMNTQLYEVRGDVTPADAEVVVNGAPVVVHSNGSFSAISSLDLGKNEIEVTAVKGSQRAEYSRVITRGSSAEQKAAQEEAKKAAEEAPAAPPPPEPEEQRELAEEETEPHPEPEPTTIPGLTAADVTINMEDQGFECGGKEIEKIGEKKYSTRTCEYDASPLWDATLDVTGDGPYDIYSVDTIVLVFNLEGDDELAGELLGYVATIPYKGSDPDQARAWVEDNVSRVDEGVVERATFGSVEYELYGAPTGRILEIDAPDWE